MVPKKAEEETTKPVTRFATKPSPVYSQPNKPYLLYLAMTIIA